MSKKYVPRLFLIDINPSCSVTERYIDDGNNRIFYGKWRRNLRDWEVEQLQELLRTAWRFLKAGSSEDRWNWTKNSSGIYSVKSAYEAISELNSRDINTLTKLENVWNKIVPFKIAAFTWKALQDRIPSIMNLWKRGAYNQNFSSLCRLCGLDNEDTNHILFDCLTAKNVWYSIYRWADFERRINTRGMEHLDEFLSMMEPDPKGVGNAVWQCTIWNIWNRRKSIIFSGIATPDVDVFEKICINTFAWLRNKNIISSVYGIADWMRDPNSCID